MGGLQARPLFEALPPVIIDKNQRLMASDNAHTTIFFPVRKYATDVHYQIIRIPIHLTPIEAGFKQAGELMHHMGNIVRGKATEAPIKQIIKHHNQTLSKVKEGYNNILLNLPAAQFTPYGSRKKEVFGPSIWNRRNGFRGGEPNRNHQNQLHYRKEHSSDRYVGRRITTPRKSSI